MALLSSRPAPAETYEGRLFDAAIALDRAGLAGVIAEALSLAPDSRERALAQRYSVAHRLPDALLSLLESGSPPELAQLNNAICEAQAECVRHLLAFGADPNGLDALGGRPLSYASELHSDSIETDRLLILDALLAAGANPNLSDKLGDTPLCLAIDKGWQACAARLLAAGADPNGPNASGMTPLGLACHFLDEPLIELLARAGADPLLPFRSWLPGLGQETPIALLERHHTDASTGIRALLSSLAEESALLAVCPSAPSAAPLRI